MEDKEKITQAIYSAVDEVNRLLPKVSRIDKSLDFIIIGEGGKLDSLGFVNLIVAVESKIMEEFGLKITLTDRRILSKDNGPLKTIRALIDYISLLLEERLNDQKRI